MHSDAGANNLPGSLHPLFTESLGVGNPLFISVQQQQKEVSVHGFTEMTIMWLTLRLDSASRHSLAQNSPGIPALSPFTFRAPGMLVKQPSINLPFLHWFAARSPEETDTGTECTLQPKAGTELPDSPTSHLHRNGEKRPVPPTY